CASLGSLARAIASWAEASCDSNPQPLMPCGNTQASAAAIETPPAMLVWPPTDSSHGRLRGVGSLAVVDSTVVISSMLQKSRHPLFLESMAPLLYRKSFMRVRQLDSTSSPCSGVYVPAGHHGLPLSVVVTPSRHGI